MVPNGWEKRDLQGLISVKHGFAFKSEYFSDNGDMVLLTPGSFYESGGFRNQGAKTKFYKGDVPRGYLLKKGDMLIAMTEQAEGLLGSALFVPENSKYLHNQRLGLVQIIRQERVCLEFLYLFFNAPSSRRQITEQSTGTKVKHTSPDRLCSVIGLIPPLPEQKKIAQILSTWDKTISTTEQLLANSQQQKKALMQQLLTGKKRLLDNNGVRFSGEWKKSTLGNLGNTFNGLTGKTKDDFGFGKKYIPYINIFKNSRIDLEALDLVDVKEGESQSLTQFGDIFFTTSSETPDEVGMSSVLLDQVDEVYLNSFCFGFRLFDFKSLLPEFARYLLRSENIRSEIAVLGQGATRYNLSKKQLMKLELVLPNINEQKKIATILSTADQEIASLQQKLDALKQEKKALMQQLLTGKRRVKVNA
ncbi:restriction endonuclease subunit S [Aeromonas sp. HZM]|uniref:restriction endonuclease subunit S n=1 Tax=Aeromonas TaxID=642 RepID=UPI0004D60013|nr:MULTISPECIES: restriction endonuclease subunit S [Aeromonas]KDV03080.1 restriction endonuclease subunit S [Aeromonas sp. HZM]